MSSASIAGPSETKTGGDGLRHAARRSPLAVDGNGRRSPIVDRSLELGLLEQVLRGAAGGPARLVVIEGEAGIGKSRLVEEVVHRAAALELRIVVGRAEELERRRPFGAIADGLGIHRNARDPRRAEIAELLYGTTGTGRLGAVLAEGPGTDFRITDAMVALVEEESRPSPTLLVVEDLHWADPATIQVLNRLARSTDELSGVLLLTCRSQPRPREVEQLIETFAERGALHVHLQALSDQSVEELARAALNAEPGPRLLEQLAGGRGSPFLVIELLAALEREGAIEQGADGRVDIREVSLPPSLRLTILHRLSFLRQDTVEMLRVASVLGSRFAVTDLSLVLDRRPTALLAAIEESVRAGVLDEDGAYLRFRHDLIRNALYHDIPGSLRVALHLQAARTLVAAGSPLPEVAEHLMLGASRGDAQAVAWLAQAAREAAPRSPSVAVALFERALELGDQSDPGRESLLADLAMSLVWSGRVADAESVCRRALAETQDAPEETPVRMCLTQTLLAQGHNEQALEEIRNGISSPTTSDRDRARFQAWAATINMAVGDLGAAEQEAEAARSTGEAMGDNLTRSIAMGVLAAVRRFQGRFAEGLSLADESIRIADRTPGREGHRFPLNLFRALLLFDLDRPEEAQAAIRRGRQLSEALGVRATLMAYHWLSALGHFFSGTWDDAMAECQASLEVGKETGMRQGLLFTYALTSIIALHRNDLGAAQEALANAEREFEGAGPQAGVDWMLWARGQLLEALDQPEAALQVLHNAWAICTAAGLVAEYPILAPDIVGLAHRLGAGDLAGEVTRALTGLASEAEVSAVKSVALHCRGVVERDPDLLATAVEAYRGRGRPFEHAMACEAAARALAGAERIAAAKPFFDEALELFEGLGAVRDVARTESEMRAHGFRRGRSGPRKRPKTGWESLTGSEMNVARLVAQGMTNRQVAEQLFLSPRTVQAHISSALAKLGLGSRVGLAAEALRSR